MSNLNTLRKMASVAELSCLDVVLTVEEARTIIREFEVVHGGNCELSGEKDTKINQLSLQVKRLGNKLAECRSAQMVDKVAALLPGQGE